MPLVSVATSGFNQLCDIEMDKINKPYLPIPAKTLSLSNGQQIVCFSAIFSIISAITSGSITLTSVVLGSLVLGDPFDNT